MPWRATWNDLIGRIVGDASETTFENALLTRLTRSSMVVTSDRLWNGGAEPGHRCSTRRISGEHATEWSRIHWLRIIVPRSELAPTFQRILLEFLSTNCQRTTTLRDTYLDDITRWPIAFSVWSLLNATRIAITYSQFPVRAVPTIFVQCYCNRRATHATAFLAAINKTGATRQSRSLLTMCFRAEIHPTFSPERAGENDTYKKIF